MAIVPEHVVNQIDKLHADLVRLNLMLENASEVELYKLREYKDWSRNGDNPNIIALALQIQAEKLTKTLERD